MTFRIGAMAAVALLAACGSQGGGSAEAQAQVATTPLEVAGVSIGMPQKRVEQVLEAAGWSLQSSPGHGWKQTIEREVARQNRAPIFPTPDAIGGWVARKGNEALEITLRPTTEGATVEKVIYRAPIAGRTSAQFRSEMVKRYGRPTIDKAPLYGDGAVWCSAGDPRCVGTKAPARLPWLTAAYNDGSRGRVTIILADGTAGQRAWEAARDGAMRASVSKPSF